MDRIAFRKPKLSVDAMGKLRFWVGLAAGVAAAVILSVFFNQWRELLRLQTVMQADLLLLTAEESSFYNGFFALLSAVLGHNLCVWVWLQHRRHWAAHHRRYKMLLSAFNLGIFWAVVLVVSRFGSLLTFVLTGLRGYDGELNLMASHPVLFWLLPLVMWLQGWLGVRQLFRVGWWMWGAATATVVLAVGLFFTTAVDEETLNKLYQQQYQRDVATLEAGLHKAKELYGIAYPAEGILALRQYHTSNAAWQLAAVREAFVQAERVSLDTILLQQMIIVNRKADDYDGRFWDYPTPQAVAQQLYRVDTASSEAKELLVLLKCMVDFMNESIAIADEQHRRAMQKGRRMSVLPIRFYWPIYKQLHHLYAALYANPHHAAQMRQMPVLLPLPVNADVDRLY